MIRRLAVLALAGCATAGAADRTTAVVPDPHAVCPAVPEQLGFLVVTGYGTGLRKGIATKAAQRDALDTMLKQHAAGYGDTFREAVQRNTVDLPGAPPTFSKGVACYPMGLRGDLLRSLETAGYDLDSQLATIAAAIGPAAAGRRVLQAPVVWAGSGSVSDLSEAMMRMLLGHLSGVNLVPGNAWEPTAATLRVTLTATTTDVVGNAVLDVGQDSKPLGGLKFPLDLFHLTAGDIGKAIPADKLGVAGDEQTGTGGLRVHVDAPITDGVACEGDVAPIRFHVDRTARVRLYSVRSDGSAYLVWPPNPEYGPGRPMGRGATQDEVYQDFTLPDNTLLPNADGTDDRLVMVSVPPGTSFGASDPWWGYCQVPGGWSAARLVPPGAAVATTSYIVQPAESRDCPYTDATDEARARRAEQGRSQAPECR